MHENTVDCHQTTQISTVYNGKKGRVSNLPLCPAATIHKLIHHSFAMQQYRIAGNFLGY